MLLLPKHETVPLVNNAQLCAPPAATSDAVSPNDAVAVGVTASDPWVVPRRPLAYWPQHQAAPATDIAQECAVPISICATVKEAGTSETYTGSPFDSKVAPLPIWPELPFPQHLRLLSNKAAHVVEPPAAIRDTVPPTAARTGSP